MPNPQTPIPQGGDVANGVQMCAIFGEIAYKRVIKKDKIRIWLCHQTSGKSDIFLVEASKAEFEKIIRDALLKGQKTIKTASGHKLPIRAIQKLI